MDGISTMTQKGQVAIPKGIRDYFNLKPSDKLRFEVKNSTIIARPIHTIEAMRGIAKARKVLTKSAYKKIIRDAVIKKFIKKNNESNY